VKFVGLGACSVLGFLFSDRCEIIFGGFRYFVCRFSKESNYFYFMSVVKNNTRFTVDPFVQKDIAPSAKLQLKHITQCVELFKSWIGYTSVRNAGSWQRVISVTSGGQLNRQGTPTMPIPRLV
jgi:hypothetical protein